MLHLFSSKFELQQNELEMIKEYLSSGDAAILDQTWKPTPSLNDIDPISDNEEEAYQADDSSADSDNDSDDNHADEQLAPKQVAATQSKQPRRKRPYSACEPQDDDNDDDDDNGLPLLSEECTQGRSGRIRKKPKQPAGFEFDKL
jgi:hypothetical protein